MDIIINAPIRKCAWCGKQIENLSAFNCAECGNPLRPLGYIVAGLGFAVKSLLLPLVLGFATYLFSVRQQETSLLIANQQKLADAFISMGATENALRKTTATIELMTHISTNETIPEKDLKTAILDYDAAFNLLGTKLAPFEEAARQTGYYTRQPTGPVSQLTQTWHRCFIDAYHAGTVAVPVDAGYWYRIEKQMENCSSDQCPRSVAEKISQVTWDIFSGTCLCGQPELRRPLTWFYEETQSIMAERDLHREVALEGGRNLSPINHSLLAPRNPYCRADVW